MVVSFATCVPLEAAWDKRVEGKCLGLVVQLGNSVLNIVTDFAIFLLPLPSIVGLRMHWRRKAGLLLVFALGFVCGCPLSPLSSLPKDNKKKKRKGHGKAGD